MYQYNARDQQLVDARVAQLRDQLERHRAGTLSAEAFRPLRLQNGLYTLRQAAMLRIAVPYGLLSGDQLRALAQVSETYGPGHGHFTTRHNFQLAGLTLEAAPLVLADLARVQLHAIQSSGSCIRNVTSDPLAGAAADEPMDPRPWCELLRQWSAGHPAFTRLPRKVKIAVQGAGADRALIQVQDIGFNLVRNAAKETGFRVLVDGGLGRTPMPALELESFLPWRHLLSYAEAICQVFNADGRRDSPHKSRLKFLVRSLGLDEFRRRVAAAWAPLKDSELTLTAARVAGIAGHFADPPYADLAGDDALHLHRVERDPAYAAWVRHNVQPHRRPGYAIVTLSTKRSDRAPGDVAAAQLRQVADWADDYSFGEVRVTQRQNLVLAQVRQSDLHALWRQAVPAGLATPNIGLLTDIVACPGGDECDLANARSVPLTKAIQARFADQGLLEEVGALVVNCSGCMNGCAHHQIADIGIRGIDKQGAEYYQLGIGGRAGADTRFGAVIGPAIPAAAVPAAVARLVDTYLSYRASGEPFADTVARIGHRPFATAAYGSAAPAPRPVRELARA
ncbi:nitrite/sulfite reductase [uncultured Thiodictyon sp.]|uniref:nitrite/sulfite reductase n=1 Tax=uncultured Thiodictyon sp. TaxID=1846217 RepID=UPI0025F1BF2C|nr:nitrite/sulfite reductase [uncultured Thiodictyon sp.]